MSKVTAKERLLAALVKSKCWRAATELESTLKVSSSVSSLYLRELVSEGLAQRVKPAPGDYPGARWIYAAAGVPLLAGGLSDDGASDKLGRLPKKVRGFRAEARARRRGKGAAQKIKLAVALPTKGVARGVAPARQWAITNDGVMLDLQSGVALSLPAARALADFVSVLRDRRVLV